MDLLAGRDRSWFGQSETGPSNGSWWIFQSNATFFVLSDRQPQCKSLCQVLFLCKFDCRQITFVDFRWFQRQIALAVWRAKRMEDTAFCRFVRAGSCGVLWLRRWGHRSFGIAAEKGEGTAIQLWRVGNRCKQSTTLVLRQTYKSLRCRCLIQSKC